MYLSICNCHYFSKLSKYSAHLYCILSIHSFLSLFILSSILLSLPSSLSKSFSYSPCTNFQKLNPIWNLPLLYHLPSASLPHLYIHIPRLFPPITEGSQHPWTRDLARTRWCCWNNTAHPHPPSSPLPFHSLCLWYFVFLDISLFSGFFQLFYFRCYYPLSFTPIYPLASIKNWSDIPKATPLNAWTSWLF